MLIAATISRVAAPPQRAGSSVRAKGLLHGLKVQKTSSYQDFNSARRRRERCDALLECGRRKAAEVNCKGVGVRRKTGYGPTLEGLRARSLRPPNRGSSRPCWFWSG